MAYSSSEASHAARLASASASARRSGFRTMLMKKYTCHPMNSAHDRMKKTISVLEKLMAITLAT
jgi:mevalonate pyrophosphate decarboxylase